MLNLFDDTVKMLYEKFFILNEQDPITMELKIIKKDKLTTVVKGLDEITSLRDLNHTQVNRMISLRGIVIRCSEINPEMTGAIFMCCNCKAEVHVRLDNARVNEPKVCERCKMKETLEIVHNSCSFIDKQFIKFQELPEFVPEG